MRPGMISRAELKSVCRSTPKITARGSGGIAPIGGTQVLRTISSMASTASPVSLSLKTQRLLNARPPITSNSCQKGFRRLIIAIRATTLNSANSTSISRSISLARKPSKPSSTHRASVRWMERTAFVARFSGLRSTLMRSMRLNQCWSDQIAIRWTGTTSARIRTPVV